MEKRLWLAAIFVLILIPVITSIDIYVRPPRMVLRMNVTPGIESTEKGSLEIKNLNDYDVNVTFRPEGDIIDKIEITRETIKLKPGEVRNVEFKVKAKEPGTYQGLVIVTYSAEGQISAGIQAEIYIIANEQPIETKEKKDFVKYAIIGFIFLIVLILALLLIKGIKKRGV
ncbi:MAG: hypothetical protein QXY45_00855 [Candidatus Aenigmatarchaeota archaeon]